MRGNRKTKSQFGKRGRKKAEAAEGKATTMERLKKLGIRWWGASSMRMTKGPQTKGFKRARSRPCRSRAT